ncbi:hypothetical protein VPH35_039610 [Triticum aestivum]
MRHLVEAMGSFEVQEFAAMCLLQEQVEGIVEIRARIDRLDSKFEEQVARLDQVQLKVNLRVSSLGDIHQDEVHVARVLKESASVREDGHARVFCKFTHGGSSTGKRVDIKETRPSSSSRGSRQGTSHPHSIPLRLMSMGRGVHGCRKWNFQSLMGRVFVFGLTIVRPIFSYIRFLKVLK